MMEAGTVAASFNVSEETVVPDLNDQRQNDREVSCESDKVNSQDDSGGADKSSPSTPKSDSNEAGIGSISSPSSEADQVLSASSLEHMANKSSETIETPESSFSKGLAALRNGEWEPAIEHFLIVIAGQTSSDPQLLNKARCRLVHALYQAGREEEADRIGLEAMNTFQTNDVSKSNQTQLEEMATENGTDNCDDKTGIATESRDESKVVKQSFSESSSKETAALSNPSLTDNSLKHDEHEMQNVISNTDLAISSENESILSKKKETKKERKKKEKQNKSKSEENWHCGYCSVTLSTPDEVQTHCSLEQHRHAVMSDEGRNWRFRPPPRGHSIESFSLCKQFSSEGLCRFGDQCVSAHSKEELREWKERLEYRHKKSQKAAKLFGKSLADVILEKLAQTKNPESVLRKQVDGIICNCSVPLEAKVSSKNSELSWIFHLENSDCKSRHILQNVTLLNDVHRRYFSLELIKHKAEFPETGCDIIKTFYPNNENNAQEWSHSQIGRFFNTIRACYKVKISFKSDIFGTFRQSIVFNFGFEPFLRQDICVDVTPVEDDSPEEKATQLVEKLVQQPEIWDASNSNIIDFEEQPLSVPSQEDLPILKKYPAPKPNNLQLSAVQQSHLSKLNYRQRMHELLFIEELAQHGEMTKFNIITKLSLVNNYLLTPTSANSSTAKYARPGELFGRMSLGSALCEDTPAGRLILTNCTTVLLKKPGDKKDHSKDSMNRNAYVSGIEDSGKDSLYLRLSPSFIKDFNLELPQSNDDNEKESKRRNVLMNHVDEVEVEVQFQLNRVPLCEMHLAVDYLPDVSLVYPDVNIKPQIPWTPGKQWNDEMANQLNAKQREAILAITTKLMYFLPPILLIGPYGTGKTFTLGQAIKILLKREEPRRILVCTHSNSAADLYIRDHLHPFCLENPDIKLLRVYYRNRRVQTVHHMVQKYCLISETETTRHFRNPTADDLKNCDVVVATLSTSRCLSSTGLLPRGYFTHILIDEAAQAMECEALMPLALANKQTRIVLAGDHMQLSPEVFSEFATEKKFNKSLLERLYDMYPSKFPCKILLCENYRSHPAIIDYTSQLFYEQKLIASAKVTEHSHFYPLTVFTARGEDVQDNNSTSFYNDAEVYEVVHQVSELQKSWPREWGARDDTAIGIVTPYYDQVQRIRSELRKRRLHGVSVERVLNVQGKQFRAIFLSTVRTRKTCVPQLLIESEDSCDFGFLSNAKLLNTAITRAQSLVAVVGDPVSLCSIGKCCKLWEKFMEVASVKNSMFGLTWHALKAMLDNVELKKTYVLNPYAAEFIPKHMKTRQREAFLYHYPQIDVLSKTNSTSSLPQGLSTTSHNFMFPHLQQAGNFTGILPPGNHKALTQGLARHSLQPNLRYPFQSNPGLAAMAAVTSLSPYSTIPPFPQASAIPPPLPPHWIQSTASWGISSGPSARSPIPNFMSTLAPPVPPPVSMRPIHHPILNNHLLLRMRQAVSTPVTPEPYRPNIPTHSPVRGMPMSDSNLPSLSQRQPQQLSKTPVPPLSSLKAPRLPNPQFANSKYQRHGGIGDDRDLTFGFPTQSLPQQSLKEILPPNIEIDALLRNPKIQIAWTTFLQNAKGSEFAESFQDFIRIKKSQMEMETLNRPQNREQSPNFEMPSNALNPNANERSAFLPHQFEAPTFTSSAASAATNNPARENQSSPWHPSSESASSRQTSTWSSFLGENTVRLDAFLESDNIDDLFNWQDRRRQMDGESNHGVPLYLRRTSSNDMEDGHHENRSTGNLNYDAERPSRPFAIGSERRHQSVSPTVPSSSVTTASSTLTYANVLRAQQPRGSNENVNFYDSDPLTRIRNLGTQGNQEREESFRW